MATDGTKIASISFGTLANQQPAGGRIFRLAEESGETGGRLPWQLTTRIEIRRNRVLRYYAALKTSVRISSSPKQKKGGKTDHHRKLSSSTNPIGHRLAFVSFCVLFLPNSLFKDRDRTVTSGSTKNKKRLLPLLTSKQGSRANHQTLRTRRPFGNIHTAARAYFESNTFRLVWCSMNRLECQVTLRLSLRIGTFTNIEPTL